MAHYSTLSCLIFSAALITAIRQPCNLPGYYWRDFTGEVPLDALPGGTDINGQPIYIGQVFNLQFLIPAKIYKNDCKAYYEYGGKEYSQTDNIKILCTVKPHHFEWIKTNNSDIKLITNRHLLLGGYEPGCTTYIGRAKQAGEVLVGKALADNGANAGLYVTSDGVGIRFPSFEVLGYNPKAYSIDLRLDSD